MTLSTIWETAKPLLKDKIGPTTYDTWFSTLLVKEKDSETLTIIAPDTFFKNWIVDHYLSSLEAVLKDLTQKSVRVEFEIDPHVLKEKIDDPLIPADKRGAAPADRSTVDLNPRFTFDNFVIGPSNRFAYAASMAVAESPAKAYNPLFIYGPVGLGKTHLMQAITHQIKVHHPDVKHCYISSEKFTNELIDAIRHRSTSQFRQKYRHIDVLLIDDIHFIAGKESTQEEFFHTFNALHNNRKQIIISSDRPPKEIANLEERLVSRFGWGLVADIQPPNFETRVAILRKKIEKEPVPVPDAVITFIADQIKTNIRELEGALIRVVAYSLLEDRPVSLDMSKAVLKDMVKETIPTISIEMVQKKVAEFFKLSVSDLKAKRRSKNILLPRQIAMHLIRHLTNFSLPEIGQSFGGKDHTTVLHSLKKIDRDLQTNKELKNTIEQLMVALKQ
ncbi:MAG: chromosomal replication initiator protein DnaA [Candidatus Omnitrophota bacterium]|nr:chromosomal replication initiator protein DnaA [Candidatus Omnitrophota bacterium]